MPSKFVWQKFADVNLDDSFFDTLKSDYPEFPHWFDKKRTSGDEALVYSDDVGIGAFIYLKNEIEQIDMVEASLPAIPRIKIGTFRLAERVRGQRLGEGALGVALWRWQATKFDEIYLTAFDKHIELINLLQRFGFVKVGTNNRGEGIYFRSRKSIDYSDAYRAFPFINPKIHKAGMVPIEEKYHDRLFPYSELKGNHKEIEEETAGNGVTKVYIGSPASPLHYEVGDPVLIYRIYEGQTGKTYKSCVTSVAVLTKIEIVKRYNTCYMSLEKFVEAAGNKSVFSVEELTSIYQNRSVVLLEMTYNIAFGKGHNVNHKSLSEKGYFTGHPYSFRYSQDQFIDIIGMGDIDVKNVIIN